MIGLLHGELIKLRTTRTALGFAAAGLLLVLASVLLQALAGDPTSLEDKRSVISGAGVVSILLLVFGVVGATGEHRHGTITPALLIAPDRVRYTAAKLIAYGLAAALIAIGVQILAVVLGLALLGGRPGPSLGSGDVLAVSAGSVVSCVLAAALGVGIGALVRNQVAAVVGSLIYLFILEPVLQGVLADVYAYTIGGSSSALAGNSFDHALAPVIGGVVLAAWALAVGTAAVLADRARDVN
jgi:hypothetical protein